MCIRDSIIALGVSLQKCVDFLVLAFTIGDVFDLKTEWAPVLPRFLTHEILNHNMIKVDNFLR